MLVKTLDKAAKWMYLYLTDGIVVDADRENRAGVDGETSTPAALKECRSFPMQNHFNTNSSPDTSNVPELVRAVNALTPAAVALALCEKQGAQTTKPLTAKQRAIRRRCAAQADANRRMWMLSYNDAVARALEAL